MIHVDVFRFFPLRLWEIYKGIETDIDGPQSL